MTLKTEITLSDIFAGISLILVIIGGVFAYYQWRRNVSLKRASYINELTEKIRTDSLIRDIIYLLDSDNHGIQMNFIRVVRWN